MAPARLQYVAISCALLRYRCNMTPLFATIIMLFSHQSSVLMFNIDLSVTHRSDQQLSQYSKIHTLDL